MIENLLFSLSIAVNIVASPLNSESQYESFITTPMGTQVMTYIHDEELSDEQIEEINNDIDDEYPNQIRIHNASNQYNCHSYAFHKKSIYNTNWLTNIEPFINDLSYIEVEQPVTSDIIVYYRNTSDEPVAIHSGIVIETYSTNYSNVCGNSSSVLVESKWGTAGVYVHRGDQCPYTRYYHPLSFGTKASFVKFYRLNPNHSHSNGYKKIDLSKHEKICANNCNLSIIENHNWSEIRIRNIAPNSPMYRIAYECLKCGERCYGNPNAI